MKSKFYINQILCLLTALLLFGCAKDLGNYSYGDINEATIEKIEKSYTILLGEKLVIDPELTFTQDKAYDENNYSFEWFALRKADVAPSEKRKDLAKTKKLDITVQVPPDSYNAYYKVTDKRTGVSILKQFDLKVETTIYEGWMVLSDVNGGGRLDMISKIENKYTHVTDILKTTGSELVLDGKPQMVYCYPFAFNEYGIYVGTDKATRRLHPETFEWKDSYDIKTEVLGQLSPDFHADVFEAVPENTGNCYMVANGEVHFYFSTMQMFYGLPINIVQGENTYFKPAPFIAARQDYGSYPSSATLFDVDKKRFLKHGGMVTKVSTYSNALNTHFDFNNVGMDLVYMTNTAYSGASTVFAVLKNNAGKMYLAQFDGATGVQSYFAEIVGADIAQATHFAVSPVFGYLFYAVGGKVYEYDLSLKSSKLMLDRGTERVSLLKFQYFTFRWSGRPESYEAFSKQLLVASYDPAKSPGDNGQLELFEVPSLNGDLISKSKYTGFGKIVSVSYRER